MMKNASHLINPVNADFVFDISVCEFIGMFWEPHLLSNKTNNRNKLVQNGFLIDGIEILENQKLETNLEIVLDDYDNEIERIKLMMN